MQEARGVPLVQAHLRLHGCPGATAEVVFVSLRAGGLEAGQTVRSSLSSGSISLLSLPEANAKHVLLSLTWVDNRATAP